LKLEESDMMEEIMTSVMEALNDIVRVNYDYMFEYIQQIGELTMYILSLGIEKVS